MLKLLVQGELDELQRFLLQFRMHPQYIIHPDSIRVDSQDEYDASLFAHFDFKPEARKNLTIQMHTEKGIIVNLSLMDGQVTKFGNGITYLSGKVYDIFG